MMADLISRAAARDIIVDMRGLCRNDVLCDAVKKINAISSVDAVPVICCLDCEHSYENAKHIDVACEWSCDPDFYCAAGERKGSE